MKKYICIDPNTSDDPKKDKSGVAYFDDRGLVLEMLSFVEVCKLLKARNKLFPVVLRIESPSAPRVDNVHRIYYGAKKAKDHNAGLNSVARAGANIGQLYQLVKNIVEVAHTLNIAVEIVNRQSREACDGPETKGIDAEYLRIEVINAKKDDENVFLSKIDSTRFNELFDFSGQSNKDTRDAALMMLPEYLNTKK